MEVELRHLRGFVALAEERHFGRAAKRLNVAQPPLSRMIQDLEKELAVKLVDRSTRPIRLTLAGEAFLEQARLTLDQARRTLDRGRAAGRGELDWLSVAALPWAYNGLLPAVVDAFRARSPEVRLTLDVMAPAEQAAALREERLDIAISQWMIDTRGLIAEPLSEEPLVALVPERHRLAERELLSLAEVAAEPFIAMCSVCTPNVAEEQAAIFRTRGLVRKVAHEACGELHQLGLVAAGLGVGLSLASSSNLRRTGVVFVALEPEVPRSAFFMLWRRGDEREVVHRFLDIARQVASASSG